MGGEGERSNRLLVEQGYLFNCVGAECKHLKLSVLKMVRFVTL